MTPEALAKVGAILDVGRLGPEAEAVAIEACAMAGVEPIRWRRDGDPEAQSASVLVTALKTGERRIPDEVMGLVSDVAPRAPLLMLCEDELVRPALRLHEGRVTLVSHPHSAARVYSQLRLALAAGGKRAHGLGWNSTRPGGGEVLARETASPAWWFGALRVGREEKPCIESRAEASGLTVALSVSGASISKRELSGAHHIASGYTPVERKRAAFATLLGESAVVVHYSTAARTWLIFDPTEGARAKLCSPHRLPNVHAIDAKCSVVTMAAVEGDLLVSGCGAWNAWLADAARPQLLDGGPAALRTLAEAAERSSSAGAALLVEVRW